MKGGDEGDAEQAKLAAEFAVFREDTVLRKAFAAPYLLGVVERVGGHSDRYVMWMGRGSVTPTCKLGKTSVCNRLTLDQYLCSEEEGEEEQDALQKGYAKVSWYKKLDNPDHVEVDALEVVDRALLHHDVVARRFASAPQGQAGEWAAGQPCCLKTCRETCLGGFQDLTFDDRMCAGLPRLGCRGMSHQWTSFVKCASCRRECC
jgi:hypothetical protein